MRKLFLTFAACATILGANAATTWQMGSNTFNIDTIFHATTGPGITTTGIRMTGADSETNTIETSVYYSIVDLTNPNIELRGVQAKDGGNTTENVNAMGKRKNTLGTGQYMVGVNGDFFNMSGSPTYTNGHSLVDGVLHNLGNAGDAWNTYASYAVVEGKKDIQLTQGLTISRPLQFPSGATHDYYINSGRWTNYLVIYTPEFGASTQTNTWGRECTMKLVSGSIEKGDAVFEVTSEVEGNTAIGAGFGNMAIPADGYVLSGVGDAYTMMGSLKIGDKISMKEPTVTLNGRTFSPQQAVAGCPIIVVEGQPAPAEYYGTAMVNVTGIQTTPAARTAIGYNQDRSKMVFLVADYYTTTWAATNNSKFSKSSGFNFARMGQLMCNLGCYTAMAFDGGGSTQLYNKELGIRNEPYGSSTYFRPVANGFFAVETTPVDNSIASLEVVQKNVKLNSGESFTPTVYGYNKYGVLVNTNVTGFTFTVNSALGTVSGTKFTAGSAKNSTHGIVALGNIKCGVRILTNGGGTFISSGEEVALEAAAPYEAEEPMGVDKEPIYLTEQWSFVTHAYNDGWDATAPNWASEDAIKAKSCPRFATAMNGKFYTVDMTTMSIAEIDSLGNMTPLYKLPSLEGRVINGVADYYGTAISHDDAGNFLIGHLFTKTDTYRIWTIYSPKTGKAKHFDIEIPANEGSSGRIDNIGRVIGDLTKDAYAYVAPVATGNAATQHGHIIHFTGGNDGDVDAVTVSSTFTPTLWMAGNGNTFSTMQPKYASISEMSGKDVTETYYYYSKDAGVAQYTCDLFTRVNGGDSQNYCLNWNNYSRLNGFDTFVMGGKRYFVVHFADASEAANNNSGQHIVVKDEMGTTVAEWDNPDYSSTAGYNTITAIPLDENNVNIYVYNCTGSCTGADKTGAIAGALLRLSIGKYEADEVVDITPSGLIFDNYDDLQPFKLTASESTGWSAPAGMYHTAHPNAFEEEGQLTVYLDRNADLKYNTQDYVDNTMQKAFVVRNLPEQGGKVLAISQPYSPGPYQFGWESAGYSSIGQLNFYVRSEDITNKPTQKHYVRVRMVYNVLLRGCHYALDVAANKPLDMVTGIYASHENNWVVPSNDHLLGALHASTGIDFAQWVDETNNIEDLPENPVVRIPETGEIDKWDDIAGHGEQSDSHNMAYIMNDQRYRTYEFDTYIDNPSKASISIQFNMRNRNANYFIKEIQFTDLGTDEASATLLGKRKLGWKYANEYEVENPGPTDGINDIVSEEATDAPAVYYNLQGVEVTNPENGIYIVKRGNKVSKEYIR